MYKQAIIFFLPASLHRAKGRRALGTPELTPKDLAS
jgi:hypothetical protein